MQVMHLRRGLAVIVVLVAALFGTAVAAGASAAAAPFCGITWGSLDRVADVASAAALVDARTGRHDCFDRVVFELGGIGTPGWQVAYVDRPTSQGSGDPVDVAGHAVLQVTITGAGYPYDTGVEEFAGPKPLR